ncbi:MAG: GMC family oxidoreductase N-terminal domain-containing protein [Haliea sp.]|nr:GMC family oxidoreductase N-terminal domain-containing protein [Haliea sp.]
MQPGQIPVQLTITSLSGGSAGCALAYRLSREASRKVLLLEAGGRTISPNSHPLGFAFLMKNPKVNWCYETEPEPNMHHRPSPGARQSARQHEQHQWHGLHSRTT